MSLFELIGFVAVVFGLVWGIYNAGDSGLWVALRGGLLGAGKGVLFYAVFMLLILSTLAIGLRYRPQFPRCRKRKCKDQDYRFVYANIVPDETADERDQQLYQQRGGLLVRCGCGDLYLRSDRDRKFYEVREDRTVVPFMKYRFCGRWRADGADGQ